MTARTRSHPWPGALAQAFRLGLREVCWQRGALVGIFLTYGVILSVWSSLFHLMPAARLARVSLGYGEMVWYLALTEVVTFSIGHAYRRVQDDIHDGEVTAFFARPVGYVAIVGAQELGQMTMKVGALLLPGALLAFALTGRVPVGPAVLVPLAVALAAGAALLLGAQMLVGLATAWLGTSRPLFFIVQKLTFVLGGLVLPLDAYPPAVAGIAAWTPFPAMLYAPASIALDGSAAHIAAVLGLQAFWLAVIWLGVAGASFAFERRLVREDLAS